MPGGRPAAVGRPPPILPVAVLCAGLAAASLLLPSAPTYDPWSWLTWGREVAHLGLDTRGQVAAWKPLPVLFTTVFSVAGGAAPALWLLVARAGALLGVVMAARVASRLGGRAAGAVAGAALLSSARFLGYLVPLGMSEPLLAGLVLWAVERHLDGHRARALALGAAAALLRPEVWPFLALYGLDLARREPPRRPLVGALLAMVPLLWFGPELWGSGDPLRSARRAELPGRGSPLLHPHPGVAVLASVARAVPAPVLAGAAVAVLLALVAPAGSSRRGRERVPAALALAGGAWVAVVAVMAEAGRGAGDQRYLIVATAVVCVLAGVGWARLARAAGALAARVAGAGRPTAVPGVVANMTLAAAVLGIVVPAGGHVRHQAGELAYQASLYRALPAAVRLAGGRARVMACGPPVTGPFQAPALAWHLGVHLDDVVAAATLSPPGGPGSPGPGAGGAALPAPPATPVGTVFRTRARRHERPEPALPPGGVGLRVLGRAGPWEVAAACAPAPGHRAGGAAYSSPPS